MGRFYQALPEYYFKEGCYIQEMLNVPEHAEMSIAKARVSVNTETVLHYLEGTTERYVIISGQGEAVIGQEVKPVTMGDVVVIEAGEHQKIINRGTVDLVFLAICTPRFELDNYYSVCKER